MKRMALLGLLALIGCGKPNTPQNVAEEWVDGLRNFDISALEELSVDELKSELRFMKAMFTAAPDEESKTREKFAKAKIEAGNVVQTGNTAKMAVKANGKDINVMIVHTNGQWKVEKMNLSDLCKEVDR